jgi:hypothetical protein
MSCHQNAKTSLKCGKSRYVGMRVTDQILIHEETKSRLTLGNACGHSVQNILPSHLLSKNTKMKMYKTIILPPVLYGYEMWSLTLKEGID